MDGFWVVIAGAGALAAIVQFVGWMNDEMNRKK